MITRLHQRPTLVRFLVYALLAAVGIVTTDAPAYAASPSGSWTNVDAYSTSPTNAAQVVGATATFTFALANADGGAVTFTSTGVGTISSQASSTGFSSATDVSASAFTVISTASADNVETVTVSSDAAGTQTLTANILDPVTHLKTSTPIVTINWITTGMKFDYKVGGVKTSSYLQSVVSNNGIYQYAGNDYTVFGNQDGKFLISIKPGTYISRIVANDALSTGRTSLCTVADASVTDCSISIAKDNLPFKILDSNDTVLKSIDGVQILAEQTASNKVDSYGFWFNAAQLDSTAFSLQDGSYKIHLFRSQADVNSWNSNDFSLTIANGAVTSLVSDGSGASLTAGTDGYLFKFLANNFDAVLSAGGVALANSWVNLNFYDPTTGTGTGRGIGTDSSGGLHRHLANGINTIYLYNNGANGTKYINTNYVITVVAGSITSVKDSKGNLVLPDSSGVYLFTLPEANVQGVFTIDGVAQQGYVQQVFDLATSRSVPFEASYIDSAGNFGLRLPAGNYRIVLVPNWSPAIPINCSVAATGTSICNAQTPAANVKLEIDNIAGVSIADHNYANLELKDANFGQNSGLNITSSRNAFYLADGDYVITVNSNTPAIDGQTRAFKFSVVNGVPSDFTDTLSNEVLKPNSSGVYQMRLLAPNFSAVVNANGTPDPNVWSWVNQAKSNFNRYSTADSTGLLTYNLPDGLNVLRVNPTGIESPTVVASVYSIQVAAGAVTSVSKDSGETITVNTDGTYTLDLRTPNIVGAVTVGGVPSTGGIWSAWNTVLNKQVDFNTSGIDSAGKFGILVPAGNYDFMFVPNGNGNVGSVLNCTANANTPTQCNAAFPANNLLLNVVNGNGSALNSTISGYINRQNTGGQSFPGWWNFNLPKDANGQLQTSLLDGKYTLNVNSTDPVNDGVSRTLNFTVASGAVTAITDPVSNESFTATANVFTIPLKTPNLKATILANGVADKYVSWYAYCTNKQNTNCWMNGSSDANGNIAARLDDGTYYLSTNATGNESPAVVSGGYTVVVENGVVTSFTNNFTNAAIVKSGDFYQLPFDVPNVVGTITVAGVAATNRLFSINGVYSVEKQTWINAARSNNGWLQGSYGLLVNTPGNYLIAITEMNKSGVFLPCTIAATGTSTCNLDIPADNLRFKVQGSDGADLFQNVGANSNINLGNTSMGFGINMSVSGQFAIPAILPTGITGNYTITVYPSDGSARHGVSTQYRVDFTTDGTAISQITNLTTNEVLTPDGTGLYTFKLSGPNLAGTVVAPDGTTPIPNTSVQAYGPIWTSMGTDTSGAFAARLNVDGSYQVWAIAPTYDMTKSDSARVPVTIGNGGGNTTLTLTLRTPDVVGTIVGPSGAVAANNYIQILKDDGMGNYNYLGQEIASSRPTDTSGKFAFYLDPGNYRFQAQADISNAGGSATVSPVCVVPTQPAAQTDCSFALNGFNTKLQILGHDGKGFQNAYIYYNFMGNPNNLNARASKYWDYGYLDAQGKTKTFLEDGNWNANVQLQSSSLEAPTQLTISVVGGVVTSVVDADGHALTADATTGYFPVQLPSSNLLGNITENGSSINYGANVTILKNQGNYYQYVSSQWSNQGKFGFLEAAGSYVIQVTPYPNTAYSAGSPVTTNNLNCVVPETGTVTCNVALKSGNFLGKITTPSGSVVTDSYAYIYNVNNDPTQKNFMFLNTQIMMYQGQFSANLERGEYRVVVQPNWNANGGYTPKIYKIVVTDTITVTDEAGIITLTPDASTGRFNLPLTRATVTGRVYASSGSTTAVPWANVHLKDPVTHADLWQYQVGTNMYGEYSMSIAEGTYDLVAQTWGGKGGSGSSVSTLRRIVVDATGTLSGESNPINLYMRDPNISLRVVLPGTSTGAAYAWVSGVFNDSYFGGSTDSSGNLTAYVDTTISSTCASVCQVTVYPNGNSNYTPKTYAITGIGDQGQLALGQISSKLSVRIPTNGDTGLPNAWAWVNVNEISDSGTVVSSTGYGTDSLGQAGLSLTTGHHYSITAYPSGDYYGRYSPKTLDIASFNPATQSTLTMTFDSPNITFIAVDRNGIGNAWGWYDISVQVDSTTAISIFTGYLNDQGRGAVYLSNGNYIATFYPGKAAGITRTATFTVAGGHIAPSPVATGISFAGDIGTVVLANGNVSGTVTSASGSVLSGISIIAIRTDVSDTATVSTATKTDGTYELFLDPAHSWRVSATDPSTASVQTAVDIPSGSGILVRDIRFI